jgi:hypothetical protein
MNIEHAVSSCGSLLSKISVSNDSKVNFLVVVGLLFFVRTTVSVIKTRNKIASIKKDCDHNLPAKLRKIVLKHRVNSNQILISCDLDLVAVSVGFIDRKIIFSKSLIGKLNTKELEAVFLHELHHINNHHAFILLLGQIVSETLFFLPVLKDILTNMAREFEKTADDAAVKYQRTTGFVKSSLIKLLGDGDRLGISPRLNVLNGEKILKVFSPRRAFLSILFFIFMSLWGHLNSNYALASVIEEKISCSFFECAKNCVVEELFSKEEIMSKAKGKM